MQRGLRATGNLPDQSNFKVGEATQRLDLRLAWTSTNDKYGLAAYVTNVLDDQYVTGVNNITTDTFGTPFASISAAAHVGRGGDGRLLTNARLSAPAICGRAPMQA